MKQSKISCSVERKSLYQKTYKATNTQKISDLDVEKNYFTQIVNLFVDLFEK